MIIVPSKVKTIQESKLLVGSFGLISNKKITCFKSANNLSILSVNFCSRDFNSRIQKKYDLLNLTLPYNTIYKHIVADISYRNLR